MSKLKLNKTQISVLANEIYTELETEANKYKESDEYKNFEDTLKNTEEAKLYNKLKKVFKELKSSEVKISSYDYHTNSLLEFYNNFVNKQKDKKFPKPKFPIITTIENKIILNTIDVDNLDELISKVKDSFKTV